MSKITIPVAMAAALFAATPTFAGEKTFQPPTATELWHLRSACHQLSQKILDQMNSNSDSNWKRWESSRYDPATGHCYVEIKEAGISGVGKGQFHRILFDGQTSKILAETGTDDRGLRVGGVNDPQHPLTPPSPNPNLLHYNDATDYINRLMSEDREGRQ